MAWYKVSYSGFYFVEADSQKEAADKDPWDGIYKEEEIYECAEVVEPVARLLERCTNG